MPEGVNIPQRKQIEARSDIVADLFLKNTLSGIMKPSGCLPFSVTSKWLRNSMKILPVISHCTVLVSVHFTSRAEFTCRSVTLYCVCTSLHVYKLVSAIRCGCLSVCSLCGCVCVCVFSVCACHIQQRGLKREKNTERKRL